MPAIILAAVCLLIGLLPADWVAHLAYRRDAIEAGEWWRLWSGHLVHYGWGHLIVDAGLIAGLGWLLRRRMSLWLLAVSMILAMPFISMAIYYELPEIAEYRGASALAMMLWVLVGVQLLRELSWVGGGLLLLLAVRILGDTLGFGELFTILPSGTTIAWQAHLAGAVAGIVVALLAFMFPYEEKKRG